MNRMFLVLLIAFTSLSFSYSQQIEIKKVFGENRFYQDGKRLYMKDVIILMENNQEALLIMKKARQNNNIAIPVSIGGAGLIGWNLGKLISGGKPNWVVAGIGAGLVGVTIKLNSNVNKYSKQAVEIYNSSLNKDSSYRFHPEFNLISNEMGIGLAVKF
ncbi:hypothetical protein [Capnocytophaga cynodegmi]|uniref:hypothetical protein n=1 Tax=Capnocytophaga cynodegmi TaxID=28189 RepID=UPI003859418A